MNTATKKKNTIAKKCIQHLHDESKVLEQYLQSARLLNTALAEGQIEKYEEYQSKQKSFLEVAKSVQSARVELKNEIAACQEKVDDASSVTISEFAKELDPSLQHQVDEGRKQVLALTREVERISRTNQSLLNRSE